MKRDNADLVSLWAKNDVAWAQEPRQVHLKYGKAVEEARKALAKKEDTPKTEAKPSKKKAKS